MCVSETKVWSWVQVRCDETSDQQLQSLTQVKVLLVLTTNSPFIWNRTFQEELSSRSQSLLRSPALRASVPPGVFSELDGWCKYHQQAEGTSPFLLWTSKKKKRREVQQRMKLFNIGTEEKTRKSDTLTRDLAGLYVHVKVWKTLTAGGVSVCLPPRRLWVQCPPHSAWWKWAAPGLELSRIKLSQLLAGWWTALIGQRSM